MGMVTAGGESRTAGIVYVVSQYRLYVGTATDAWKTRHIQQNPSVSLTIPIAKRIPLLPWIRIPSATITFSADAHVLPWDDVTSEVKNSLFRGMAVDDEFVKGTCVLEIQPRGRFLTYGVGVSLLDMRDPEKASGSVPVAS